MCVFVFGCVFVLVAVFVCVSGLVGGSGGDDVCVCVCMLLKVKLSNEPSCPIVSRSVGRLVCNNFLKSDRIGALVCFPNKTK